MVTKAIKILVRNRERVSGCRPHILHHKYCESIPADSGFSLSTSVAQKQYSIDLLFEEILWLLGVFQK